MSRFLSAKRCHLSFGVQKTQQSIASYCSLPNNNHPVSSFWAVLYFLCPVPQCNILARPPFCLATLPHLCYLQLPYISRKDRNEAVPSKAEMILSNTLDYNLHAFRLSFCLVFGHNQPPKPLIQPNKQAGP